MGIIEISVALIAVAFVVLVIYIVKTLLTVQQSLQELSENMATIEKRVDELSRETTALIRRTNQLTEDIYNKSQSLNQLFKSAEEIGQATRQVSSSMKEISSTIMDSVTRSVRQTAIKHQSKVDEIMKYVTLFLDLWHKWQSYRVQKDLDHNKGGMRDG
ncbi:UPF0478 protein YtxG [Caldalkalibacillus thermarum]|uniref:DUF948 domain-containing protein n=1 Tax=Caldalkalibacillus thermarum TaxID=296745 RepID=UPI00166E1814|nr:DUF948 domain-containing protein [Caldalkalibacillus thermarum]GGK12093.1 UPF0478 protein YtxG [Caldalkalibacillus thermarum]